MLHGVFFGELLGSMTLIILGSGVVAGNVLKHSKSENSGWIVVTAGWCFAVMMGIFVAKAAGSAQADINPAITLAKYLLGTYSSILTVFSMWAAQVIGCCLGGIIVYLAYLSHWDKTDNQESKLAVFSTVPAIRHKRNNFITEVIGTFILVIFMGGLISFGAILPVSGINAPYVFGFAVWGIGLSLGGPTGYAINPARDLGPRIAHMILPIPNKGSSDWGYAWVPVLGPLTGAVLGFACIRIFMF